MLLSFALIYSGSNLIYISVSDFSDFIKKASNYQLSNFFAKTNEVILKLGIDKTGYKVISNSGKDGGQEVPHFHIHILGGEKIIQTATTL